ncbi:hypothetical protein V7138_19340 [Bacillus sp. JJ1533]|uniref:hypothetical protein n=1 Tax=Bacillus sp. JJ1533 TaxID=3122959 RepID=UPI002FFEF3E7
MNYSSRWIVALILMVFTILLFKNGIDLWSLGTNVDGAGTGIYFLGLEINDRVREENIPLYSIGFFISSIVALIISIALVCIKFRKREG